MAGQLQIWKTSGEFASQKILITMNRGNKEVEVQGDKAVSRLGNRRRDWVNSEHRDINNLEEAKFSEVSEDSCIKDYEYMFKEIHEDEDFENYKYVDNGDWEHEAWGFGEGYNEEQEDEEGKENDINGDGNNNGDETDEAGSISQELQGQVMREEVEFIS